MRFFWILASLFLCGGVQAHLDYSILSDSGIPFRNYQDIQKDLIRWSENSPMQTEYVNIGKSQEGKDISGILIYDKSLPKGIQKLILITGATHGNEYLGVADRLPEEFLNTENLSFQNYYAQGGAFLVVPILNPDGYSKRVRYNSKGVDLNRDFPNDRISLSGFKQMETRALGSFIETLLAETKAEFVVAVDYHCCDGSLLYPFSYTRERMPQEDLDRHIFIADLMNIQFPNYRHGITGEVLGYFPKGTSKDYWYLKYGAAAFTFEGSYRNERKQLEEHKDWWSSVVESYSFPYRGLEANLY